MVSFSGILLAFHAVILDAIRMASLDVIRTTLFEAIRTIIFRVMDGMFIRVPVLLDLHPVASSAFSTGHAMSHENQYSRHMRTSMHVWIDLILAEPLHVPGVVFGSAVHVLGLRGVSISQRMACGSLNRWDMNLHC